MEKLALILVVCLFWSCNNDDQSETALFTIAVPETMSKTEWRSAINVQAAKPIIEAGKIYAYQDYIFIIEKLKGVHVIDNREPTNPQVISFINIPGTEDISVKNDFLYADSAIDLVIFDISNINAIQSVDRLEDVFTHYKDLQIPAEAKWGDYSNYDWQTQVIIGWKLVRRLETINSEAVFVFNESFGITNNAVANNNIGTAGSLARFQIVDDYLYTVGTFKLNTFEITNLSQPNLVGTTYSG